MLSSSSPVNSCTCWHGERRPACAIRAWNAFMYDSTEEVKGNRTKSARWLVLIGGPKSW
jgi:hypothetical protein